MEWLQQYLVSVTAAGIICSIAKSACDGKTVSGSMIRLIAGIVMTVTVLSPVMTLKVDNLPDLAADWTIDAGAAVAEGKEMAAEQVNAIISDRVSAYILDKAAAFGAELYVEVRMPADGSGQPESVVLRGNVSPYAKSRLQRIIAEEILIPKENQQWIS